MSKTLCHMPCSLFMTNQNMSDRAIKNWVVHRKNRSPGQAEDDLNSLEFEGLNQGLSTIGVHIAIPGLLLNGTGLVLL